MIDDIRTHWLACAKCGKPWEPEWRDVSGDKVEACRYCGCIDCIHVWGDD